MPLQKAIASFLKPDGTWEPQRNVDMHPLEESEILAEWALNDIKHALPEAPSQLQEHEWLIEHGADFVKQKRNEHKQAWDNAKGQIEAAQAKLDKCRKTWCDHVDHCVANGFDKDTHEKEKHRVT